MATLRKERQACAISTVAWFFGEKRVPQIATRVEQVSEWITMSTPGAEFVRSGGKRLPLWQKTPDAGTKRQDQCLPLFARFLKRAGSRAHQGSGKRQTPAPPWMALCSTRRRSPTTSPGIWKCKHGRSGWALAQFGHGERYLSSPILPSRPGLN